MERKNLGIIQIDLPEITLGDSFNSGYGTTITSLLSKEQKDSIEKASKGDKVVYFNLKLITDGDGETTPPSNLVPCSIVKGSSSTQFVLVDLYSASADNHVSIHISISNLGEIKIYS